MLNLAELRKKRDAGEDGFTLIELLVVVVIIGILIAIAIPVYLNYQKGANDKAAQSDLRNAVSTLEQCNSDNSKYPATADFPTGGGTMAATTSCPNQTVSASANTTFKYTAGTNQASYILASTNSSGTPKVYCYNSTKGGSVTTLASGTALSAATC